MVRSINEFFKTHNYRRRMDRLYQKFLDIAANNETSLVEYGNLRRSQLWGVRENHTLIFNFEVDVIAERPFVYHVVYDFNRKLFFCYSHMGGKNDLSNVLQFTAPDFKILAAKLTTLVKHIPAVRERFMRQYIYNLAHQQKGRRWFRFFSRSAGKDEYLSSVLRNLLDEKKISQREFDRLSAYARELS